MVIKEGGIIKAGRLKEILENVDTDTCVFIAKQKCGSLGNIMYLDQVEKSTYSTFGVKKSCIILHTEYSKPEMVDKEGVIERDYIELN